MKFKIGLAALLLASSCAVDDKLADYGDAVSFSSSVSTYGDESYEWGFGDSVGISIYDNEANVVVDNVKYTNTAQSGTSATFKAANSDDTINWSDLGTGGLYTVYAPYHDDVDNSKIALDLSDQTTSTALDMMVATGSVLSIEEGLEFSHRLAVLNFNITADQDFSQAQLYNLTYELDGLVTAGTYNLYSNHISLSSDRTAVTGLSISEGVVVGTISVIVLPQDLATVSLKYDASSVDGVESGEISGDIDGRVIEAGKSYNFDVDISRASAHVTGSSITDWDVEQSVDVGNVYSELVIEVGDFILQDGSLLKAANWEDITDSNPAIGVFYVASTDEGGSRAISVKRSGNVNFSSNTTFTAAVENNDGRIATDYFFAQGGQTISNYPAFEFCHNLNVQMGKFTANDNTSVYTGVNDIWYLPARYEAVVTSGDTNVANIIFSTFAVANAGVLASTSGYDSYTETTLGTASAVYTGATDIEETIMKSIYRAGGDPFDDFWVRNADGSESTEWTTGYKTKGDDEIEALRGTYNELEGFNSIRYSFDFVLSSTSYSKIVQHWISTTVGASNVNAYYIGYTRSSNGSSSYRRGPNSSGRAANSFQTRAILRH